jgi:hypothetical protein
MRDFCPWTIFTICAVNDLVVDVGDIGDQTHLNTRPLHISTQNVVDQCGSAVAQMRRAIDGRTAQIDAQLARLAHFEFAHIACHGVI